MTLDPAAETALRNRAGRLQALHIKLLFCRHTREAWSKSPETVLDELGLPLDTKNLLVDIGSDQFKAESYGRRIMVERSVSNSFGGTRKYMAQNAAASGDRGADPTFDDFLCSEYFLDPRHGLPHSSGIGPGYENISKYFFWLRTAVGLDRESVDVTLRTHAYSEFAFYLINQFKRPHEPFYDQFQGGLYWVKAPGTPMPVMLLSDKFVLYTLNSSETVAQLPDSGLVDLDRFSPPEWRMEETLV